jgi:hypothetical protein
MHSVSRACSWQKVARTHTAGASISRQATYQPRDPPLRATNLCLGPFPAGEIDIELTSLWEGADGGQTPVTRVYPHTHRIPVSNSRTTVVKPLDPTSTCFACEEGAMIGASVAGTTRYVPGARRDSKWPLASEWNVVTVRPFWRTVKPALNGSSQRTSTLHTGVIGPRNTVPVRPVSVGEDGPLHRAASKTADATSICRQPVLRTCGGRAHHRISLEFAERGEAGRHLRDRALERFAIFP